MVVSYETVDLCGKNGINWSWCQIFTGKVISYDDEMDNESGEYSIYLDTGIQIYDFDESEIKSIETLD